ncbi:MAG: sulfite reductase subunit A [Nitrospirales bacterium]|nr:sulfite reductase subunit A [Nitrospirales bacterium]
MHPSSPQFSGRLARDDFSHLLIALKQAGYQILGPVVRDGAITWGEIAKVDDLPIGWHDHQQPGQYRLEQKGTQRFFDVVHGPESLKRETFVLREPLLTIERRNKSFSVQPVLPQSTPTAMLGVRACDLAALTIQDRIFLHDQFSDPYYKTRRESLFLIAVNCTRALETCFCASMDTGPKAKSGFDLVLTEDDEDFILEAGSPAGDEIFQKLPLAPVSDARLKQDNNRIEACAASQTRKIDASRLPEILYEAYDHSRWDEVANRCLACTNCTMVCPTCFCHAVEEQPELTQQKSEHTRVWDSCFTPDHGYIHGKNFRPTIKDRYRMWLTHKLGTWVDQFGMSGCVGCGRCITWCPVGIDLTEEIHILCNQPDRAKNK